MNTLAILSLIAAGIALVSLTALHFVSPEFSPSWRMISEYALGKHKWLITLFFLSWAASSLLLAMHLTTRVHGFWPVFGLVLLYISAAGELMGGLYDVNHKNHGLAFGLGIPTLPVAALLIGYFLVRSQQFPQAQSSILFWSHAPWASLILMAAAMGVMITGFQKAGIAMGPNIPPPESVPSGVIALAGYANRLLVFCYLWWLIIIAKLYLR